MEAVVVADMIYLSYIWAEIEARNNPSRSEYARPGKRKRLGVLNEKDKLDWRSASGVCEKRV